LSNFLAAAFFAPSKNNPAILATLIVVETAKKRQYRRV
jgi:hypothetical protein